MLVLVVDGAVGAVVGNAGVDVNAALLFVDRSRFGGVGYPVLLLLLLLLLLLPLLLNWKLL